MSQEGEWKQLATPYEYKKKGKAYILVLDTNGAIYERSFDRTERYNLRVISGSWHRYNGDEWVQLLDEYNMNGQSQVVNEERFTPQTNKEGGIIPLEEARSIDPEKDAPQALRSNEFNVTIDPNILRGITKEKAEEIITHNKQMFGKGGFLPINAENRIAEACEYLKNANLLSDDEKEVCKRKLLGWSWTKEEAKRIIESRKKFLVEKKGIFYSDEYLKAACEYLEKKVSLANDEKKICAYLHK